MFESQGAKRTFARRGQANEDFAAILGGGFADDGAVIGQAIDQLDRAVMTNLKAIGEFGNGRELSRRQAFDREEELMLLRLDSMGSGGFFAIAEEFPDLVAEFGQRAI